ncbi:MAG: enoyl-CoA hydratase/isomerase family protein [Deltaproteobacteria bacterium]|nr:enoyl-CoA hydratase/isomerase family protein [Deltaproteobacteria bacterium]
MKSREQGPVLVRADGPAGWLVLDRHERRNALNRASIDAIVEGIAQLEHDDAVRAIVLAAEGTVFCGGADLKELSRGGGREGIRVYATAIEAIMSASKPVIARVQGPAAGGGVGLVAACHLACGTPAARLLTPEVKSGLYPLMVHALVEGTIGRKRAFAMDLVGRELSAHEARDIGLLNDVVDEEDLDETVGRWIEALSSVPPSTMAQALGALHRTRHEDTLSRVLELQHELNEIADSR